LGINLKNDPIEIIEEIQPNVQPVPIVVQNDANQIVNDPNKDVIETNDPIQNLINPTPVNRSKRLTKDEKKRIQFQVQEEFDKNIEKKMILFCRSTRRLQCHKMLSLVTLEKSILLEDEESI
jgi:hypothetical protein